MEAKKQLLKLCMQKGFLLDKDILDLLLSFEENFSLELINSLYNLNIKERVINKSIFFNNYNLLKKVLLGKNYELFNDFLIKLDFQFPSEDKIDITTSNNAVKDHKFKIVSSSLVIPKKLEVQDFVKHFRARYEALRNILQERNLDNLRSIRRLSEERETQHVIVMILNKRVTKNKNLIFDVEDLTGRSKILINGNKGDLFERCKNILPDEVVAFSVSGNKEIMFANEVIFPDSILSEKKKNKEEVLVAFTSDIHVGSKMFLEKNFLKFIKWLNGEEGDEEQKNLSKKVKYLFLVGDNVDGVGVFPDQEKLLVIPDTINQYKKLSEYLKLIREDIHIFMCPGQHDAVWVGEPQPAIGENWAPDLYKMKNLTLVTNPCLVEIEDGFRILMYHGASFHGIIEEINEIRVKYGHKSPTIVVKELLKRRHLAPLHGSCDYVPSDIKDPMVIDILPDIVATGDSHRQEISSYNNVLLIASSCWQSITPFEEKVGNVPDPCKVPLFNLKSREIKIIDFTDSEKKEDLAEQDCKESNGAVVCEVKK